VRFTAGLEKNRIMMGRKYTSTERLEGLLCDLVNRKPITQAILGIESGDRSFRWIGVEGTTASGARVVEDTPFFIASIDKLCNATVTMMLNETGQIDIDEPICAYLAPGITRGIHRHSGRDFSEKITIRHLLTHTSGLADWLEDYPKAGHNLFEIILKEGDRTLTVEELAAHVRERLTPHFPPQDLSRKRPKTRYSDTNFIMVIAIIEAVTGQPLYAVHKKMLYEPLRLRQTYFPSVNRPTHSKKEPMVLRARAEPLIIPLLIESIRGIYSTASDMITFMRAFINSEMFQCGETLEVMQRNWHRFGFPLDRAALRSPGWPVEYGMGLMRFRLPRLFTPTDHMPAVLGHTGSTGCWLFYCKELDVYFVGSVDEITAGAVPFRIVPKILKVFRTIKGKASKNMKDI
jgi:CubicO group peptidase (beta-lactamase class C family)